MKTVYLEPGAATTLMDRFHSYNHPGGFITGQSQSAKTASMGTLMLEDMRAKRPMTAILPHHQPSDRLIDLWIRLPSSQRLPLNFICPADGLGGCPNPLHWNDVSEISAAVVTTRRIIKQAYGDPLHAETQSNIDYAMDLALEATALLRKPLPTCADFLDRTAPDHYRLLDELARVEPGLAAKLDQFDQLSLREWISTVLPALKRLDVVLKKNPLIYDLLSNSEGFDARSLIREPSINLISLKLGSKSGRSVLRPVDRRFLACGWAKAMLDAGYALDEADRHELTFWYDELPLLEALFEDIERGLSESAKYRVKQIGATQTAYAFEDAGDSPLLNAFLTNTHFHFHFRSQGELDSRLFTTASFLKHYSPRKKKHVLTNDVQYLVSQDIVTLVNETFNWGTGVQVGAQQSDGLRVGENESEDESESGGNSLTDTISGSHTKGTKRSNTASTTNSQQDAEGRRPTHGTANGQVTGTAEEESDTNGKSQAVGRTVERGRRRGRGRSRGADHSQGTNAAITNQHGGSRSFVQTIVPRYGWRKVIQAIQFLTPEEQRLVWAALLVGMPTGQCLLYVTGMGTVHLVFPMPTDYGRQMPEFLRKERAAFLTELRKRPMYAAIEQKKDQPALGHALDSKAVPAPQVLTPEPMPARDPQDDFIIDI